MKSLFAVRMNFGVPIKFSVRHFTLVILIFKLKKKNAELRLLCIVWDIQFYM